MVSLSLHANNELLNFSLEELLQIQVNGPTLTFESLETSPAAISVYTQNELNFIGMDTLDELMNVTLGYQSFRSSNSSIQHLYSSRGRRISGTGSELLLLVDGHRIDGPRTSGSNVVVPKFSLKNIKRVEFIRGPGSAIYGSNAMMGVINIATNDNMNEMGFSLGSLDRKKSHIYFSDRVDHFKINFFAHYDQDNGASYRVPDTFSSNEIITSDPRETIDYNLKLSFKQTHFNYQRYQFDTEDFYESGYLSNEYNRRSASIDSFSIKQEYFTNNISSYFLFDYHQTHSEATVQTTPYGALHEVSSPQSMEPLVFDFVSPHYKESRLLWHNDWTINYSNFLQWGVEYRHIDAPDYYSSNNFGMDDILSGHFPIRYYGESGKAIVVQSESQRTIFGVYTQYQSELRENLNLTAGLRYDSFSDIGSQLSPRLALIKRFNKSQTFKLLYGRAFRAPTESELNLKNNPVFIGNNNLRSEVVDSYEVIWLGKFDNLQASVGYFENHFHDTIFQKDIGNGIIRFDNYDDGQNSGMEFELLYQFNRNALIRLNHTNIFQKPDLAYTEADEMTSLLVNYQKDKFNFNLIISHTGDRNMPAIDGSGKKLGIDSFMQVFGKVTYAPTSDWEFYIQSKNLFNENYTTPPITAIIRNGIPNRGQEWLIGGKWKF